MTREEFAGKIAPAIDVINGGKMLFDSVEKAEVWYRCLSDLDVKMCEKAVLNLALTHTYGIKIADIRKAYAELVTASDLPVEEAWAICREAIRGTYTFESLPEDVRKAVVDPMILWEWGQLSSKEVDTVIQGYFRKSYESVLERKKEDAVLGAIGAKAGAFALERKERMRLEVHDEDNN